jgi:hypothetical protein
MAEKGENLSFRTIRDHVEKQGLSCKLKKPLAAKYYLLDGPSAHITPRPDFHNLLV